MDFLKSAIHVIVFQEYDLEYENNGEKNEEWKKEEGEEKKNNIWRDNSWSFFQKYERYQAGDSKSFMNLKCVRVHLNLRYKKRGRWLIT